MPQGLILGYNDDEFSKLNGVILMDEFISNEEQVEDLQYKGYKIIQKKSGFKFGVDAVLAAYYAEQFIRPSDSIADLGTGSGIIAILLAAHTQAGRIVGMEIQENIAQMAQRSVVMNKLENRVEIKNVDLRSVSDIVQRGSFDHVVTNPPYKKVGSGIVNSLDNKALSRHEILCTLEDVISAGAFLLKQGGYFTMIHRPERLNDIIMIMRENSVEPKFMRFIFPNMNKPPNLLLIRGVKGGKPFLKIDKPLCIFDQNGAYTDEINKIYDRD